MKSNLAVTNEKRKQKKNRRFKRKPLASVNVVNVENNLLPGTELNNHVSRLHGKVKNLSSVEFTADQQSLLELGPKFCPVEPDINRAKFQKDLNAGFRRMKLKEHFFPDEDIRTEEQKRLS